MCAGMPVIGWPSKQHSALARTDEPHDGLERGALADAVAPEQPDHLAPADLQRHAVQDVALAVIGVQVLDRDQRLRLVCAGALMS